MQHIRSAIILKFLTQTLDPLCENNNNDNRNGGCDQVDGNDDDVAKVYTFLIFSAE